MFVMFSKQFFVTQPNSLKMARRIVFSASLRKEVCHEGTKARSRKMLRIFLCARPAEPFGRALES